MPSTWLDVMSTLVQPRLLDANPPGYGIVMRASPNVASMPPGKSRYRSRASLSHSAGFRVLINDCICPVRLSYSDFDPSSSQSCHAASRLLFIALPLAANSSLAEAE